MKKLKINFKNCYGIKDLEHEFDFSDKKIFSVYAPNGVMKTSFAKTFKDLQKDEESKDLVFTDRKTTRTIQDENNNLLPEEIFVIEPYNEDFKSDKLPTLVVRKELKEEYEKIYKVLDEEKRLFITKLKNVSRSTDCEGEFTNTFLENKKDTFFDLLDTAYQNLDGNIEKYDFKYNAIFDTNGKVKKFLEKHQESLDLYIENYESLISSSTFFKKSENTFGTYQASEILKSIQDGSYFDAGHSLELNDNTIIDSAETFKQLVEDEIKKVVEDEKLKKVFDKITKAIDANAELRAFKNVIEKNNLLLIELKNYEEFKKKVWLGYLNELKKDASILIESYKARKKQLEDIINEALKSETEWENAVAEFNERFLGLPFRLTIQNKEDVILKINEPTIAFIFQDSKEKKDIKRDDLLQILSYGEKKHYTF